MTSVPSSAKANTTPRAGKKPQYTEIVYLALPRDGPDIPDGDEENVGDNHEDGNDTASQGSDA